MTGEFQSLTLAGDPAIEDHLAKNRRGVRS
jgi:hypothetical protein